MKLRNKTSKEDQKKIYAAAKCLLSDVTQQSIQMTLKNMLGDCPYHEEIKYDIDISTYTPGELSLIASIRDNNLYNWLMNRPETYINKDITARLTKDCIFISHEDTKVSIVLYVYCDLPLEDFQTLDMLGKVHRSFTKSRVDKFIYCEI